MEDLYRLDLAAGSEDDMAMRVGKFSLGNCPTASACEFHNSLFHQFDITTGSSTSDFDLIKAQIANHPHYPNLVSAHIECQKLGAPPEMASLFEEIRRENTPTRSCSSEVGTDPELDKFMESYCEVLLKYKEEISKPFDEATNFFSNMESQLTNLSKGEILITRTLDYRLDETDGTSEEELNYANTAGFGENKSLEFQDSWGPGAPGDKPDVKSMLMRKYRGYLSSLKKEFLKKRKNGKLPKDARNILMDWWNSHCRWPYPTEEEKLKLSEETGLDRKQINNWFINQRKRHWKPSEDMRFAILEGPRIGDNHNMNGESMFFNPTDSIEYPK